MNETKSMTVSVKKGKAYDRTSTTHNLRKTKLEKFSKKQKDAFYDKTGHTHIMPEYTHLNEDLEQNNLDDIYDTYFGDAVAEYNKKQRRNDRKIGGADALTREEKARRVEVLTLASRYIHATKTEQKAIKQNIAKLPPDLKKVFDDTLNTWDGMSKRDIQKALTRAKNADTTGVAYKKKVKKDAHQKVMREMIFTIGNAEDFNKVDENGRLTESLDREDPEGKWQRAKKALEDYYKAFKKANLNFKIVSASIHMDEKTPHLHCQFVPVADRTKLKRNAKKKRLNGVKIRPNFDDSLELMGYTKNKNNDFSLFQDFHNAEIKRLAGTMLKDMGYTRKLGETNNIKDVHAYKKAMEEIAKLKEQSNKLKSENKSLSEQVKNLAPLAKNYTVLDNGVKKKEARSKALDTEIETKMLEKSTLTQQVSDAKTEKAEAEKARDDAKTETITIKQNNQAYINQLNRDYKSKLDEREKEQDKREKALDKKEASLNTIIKQEVEKRYKRAKQVLLKAFKKPLTAFYKAYDKALGYSDTDANAVELDLLTDEGAKKAHKGIKAGLTAFGNSLTDYKDLERVIDEDDKLHYYQTQIDAEKAKPQKSANIPKNDTPKKQKQDKDVTDDAF